MPDQRAADHMHPLKAAGNSTSATYQLFASVWCKAFISWRAGVVQRARGRRTVDQARHVLWK